MRIFKHYHSSGLCLSLMTVDDATFLPPPYVESSKAEVEQWIKDNPPPPPEVYDPVTERAALLDEKAALESKVAEISVKVAELDAKIAAEVKAPK